MALKKEGTHVLFPSTRWFRYGVPSRVNTLGALLKRKTQCRSKIITTRGKVTELNAGTNNEYEI